MAFLEVKNLTKKYKNQLVLNDISISFSSKGLYCLIGESGGGKSTFINCISGIEKIDKGKIYFQNKRIRNFDKFRNKYVSMVYQNSNLISFLNVKDNIYIKGKNDLDLEKVNVNSFVNTKINVLSGGEIQRVGIARGICGNSKILLLDEPTGSLDKDNSYKIMDIIKELSKSYLVIMVSHNLELVKKYKATIISLKDGKIINTKEVKENNTLFSEKLKRLSLVNTIKIAIKTLFKSKIKILISVIALSISLTFLLLSYSASVNIHNLINDNKTNYLDYTLLKISKEKTNKIENSSLTLVKEEQLTNIDKISIDHLINIDSYLYDLSPIFSSYPLINHPVNSEYFFSNIEWVPYFKKEENRFKNKIQGRFPSYEKEVVVNKAASKYFSNNRFNINLEKVIDLKLSNNEIISDTYFIDMTFIIVGQVEEFDMLETPKIYYPYEYLLKISKDINLDNLSSYLETPVTLFDRLSTIKGIDDAFASNKLIVQVDLKKVNYVYREVNAYFMDEIQFKAYSSSIEKIKLFEGIYSSISTVLDIFVSITLIISVALLTLVLFSYVLDFKKDIGIMLGIGILKEDVSYIFMFQSILISLLSIFVSIVLYFSSIKIINSYLLSLVGIEVLSESILFQGIIFIIFISLLISIFLSFLVSRKIVKLNVSSILKED